MNERGNVLLNMTAGTFTLVVPLELLVNVNSYRIVPKLSYELCQLWPTKESNGAL